MAKKTTKKKAGSKKSTKKKVAKKTAAKSTKNKVAAKTTKKKAAKKTSKKKAGSKKAASKKTTTKKSAARAASTTTRVNGKAKAPAKPAPVTDADELLPEEIDWTDDRLRAVDTGLSEDDLAYFRQQLLIRRAEILGDVEAMQEARNSADGGEISHMPLHMADVGSDNYEQEFTLGLMESERRTIRDIDQALIRLENGTYGVCIETGQPIPRARLEAKPWAKYTIEVARERERRGLDL